MIDQDVEKLELFDLQRASLSKKPIFPPFYIKNMSRLSDMVQAGQVASDMSLLVLTHPAGVIALDKTQMAQHHVAQGEIAGEPWLVTF